MLGEEVGVFVWFQLQPVVLPGVRCKHPEPFSFPLAPSVGVLAPMVTPELLAYPVYLR